MKPSFFITHKKALVAAIIGVTIAGAVPGTLWMHNAWGDNRYVQQLQGLRDQIQTIDNTLFEIDQEISFSVTDSERSKWVARKNHYLRQKEALQERLQSQAANN